MNEGRAKVGMKEEQEEEEGIGGGKGRGEEGAEWRKRLEEHRARGRSR